MDIGIVNFGCYVPVHRMPREVIGQAWGKQTRPGEKAVANWDEDSLTMGVQACMDIFSDLDRSSVGALYFASLSLPYIEKQSASIMAKALDLSPSIFTADVSSSLRSATIALKIAMDTLRAESLESVLIASADCRIPPPNSEMELTFGDGAAALLLGKTNLLARINETFSISSEFMDVWRRDQDRYPQTWEDRFLMVEGYSKLLPEAISGLLKRVNGQPKDYQKVAVYGPDARNLSAVLRRMGFDPKSQAQTSLFDTVGNTGSPFSLMMLAQILEGAKPGDRILLAGYGDGADAFDLTVTDQISRASRKGNLSSYLRSKMDIANYGRYLRFRNMMTWEVERRAPDKTSLNVLSRESKQIYSLRGHQCKICGTIQFPMQRICTQCQTKDRFDEVRLSDRRGRIFTFSLDERAMVPDLPNVLAIVDLEGGGRFYSVMTDRDPQKIEINQPVELTFRKIHEGSGIYNYFWKVRPLRE